MSTETTTKTSLDDLVTLLLQGQAPFGDAELMAATEFYRQNTRGGKLVRRQVNWTIALYLQIKEERITEPRMRELGGWGSRNDVLADIADFHAGRRPASSVGVGAAARALGAQPTNIIQIALTQGIEAAQEAMETEFAAKLERRAKEIEALADQRVQAAERNVLAATELKEVAQANAQLMEHKFDQAIVGRTELTTRAEVAEARAKELAEQVAALTAALADANRRLDAASHDASELTTKVEQLRDKGEADRKEHMLALDRARHGNDQILANLQHEISRHSTLLEQAQAAGEEHAQSARRADAEVASTRAELAAAVEKIADQQGRIEVLSIQLDEATVRAGAGEAIVQALQVLRTDITNLSTTVATAQGLDGLGAGLDRLESLIKTLRKPKGD